MRRSQSVSKVRKILLKSVDDTQNCIFLCAYSNDLSILNVHMHIQRLLHPNIDAIAGAGDVVVAAEGKGPLDDRGEYGGNRRRWGDYSAAAVDGNEVTFVSNYIESR